MLDEYQKALAFIKAPVEGNNYRLSDKNESFEKTAESSQRVETKNQVFRPSSSSFASLTFEETKLDPEQYR